MALLLRILAATLTCLGSGALIGAAIILTIALVRDVSLIEWRVWLAFAVSAAILAAAIALWTIARRRESQEEFDKFIGELASEEFAPKRRHLDIGEIRGWSTDRRRFDHLKGDPA